MKRKKLSIFILSAAIVTSSVSYGMTAKADEVKETKGYNYNVNLSEQKAVANNKISVKKVNGEILGYANPFTMLQILNMNGKTVEVITQSGLRGYVDANEFTLVESAVNDKLIEKNIEGHVTNVSTVLNLRKEPRIGAEIINRLLNNTKVNILGKQGSWYKIELNGQKGYVYGMFLNEGTMKENSSKTIANKKSEVKSKDKKEKKSSVKKEAKKEVVSGAKAKVAQKQREEAKANMTSEAKPAINKETKSNNKVEVKSEVKKEAKNEVKTEMNSSTKAETKQVVISEMVQAVNTEVKSEKNQETNLQVRPEIKSEEKTEMISKENLNVIPEAKKEEVSEEIKPEINTEVESKPEMNKEVKVEETKVEEKQEAKPFKDSEEKVEAKKEEVQDPKAKEMDELLKSEEYKFLRMSISYGERLVDRNDIYTKDSLKILRTELAKAKKVFQDKDNLTMKLVQDTRDDLERAIVDLVKLSDVKKPVKSKAKVEVKQESNTDKKQEVKTAPEVKVEEKQEAKPVKGSEEKVESKQEPKQAEVQDPKAKEMDELLKSEEYKFLRMSISYGERLVDRNDIYTKDSLKILRTELAKAKKVFQDKDNLTMKLVQDTRDDLERAIVDLVKLSDVKKPVKSKAKVEAKKESNTEKKQEVKEQPAKAEVIVPEVKENKEIKKEEPVKAKEVVKEKKSREEEIEEILKSEEYRFLLKDIAYGERLSEKITVYTRDSLKVLNAAIEKAGRIVRQKEKLTVKLVQDTRDDVDRAIVDLVKKNN